MRFVFLDWVVVGVYFAALLGIAAWVARRRQQTAADYFLAGRHVGWFAIGASLRAVVYTEVLQAFVLVGGSAAVTVFGLAEIGGWDGLREAVGGELFDMWKPLDDRDSG